jgi:glycosyltransferase involved in cell wall biosynthesis
MRVFFLADSCSAHTKRWALALAERGIEIGLYSFREPDSPWAENNPNISILSQGTNTNFAQKLWTKIGYLSHLSEVKRAIKKFKPDVVHAHYASSYGLLGRLSGFEPLFISAWGSDVMEFPKKNYFFKEIVRKNLIAAQRVFCTSQTLMDHVKNIASIQPVYLPWGVDTSLFHPITEEKENNIITIGTVKSLESVYRIDLLILAFSMLKKRQKLQNIRLMIVGGGSLEHELRSLSMTLGLSDQVEFTGKIEPQLIPAYHRQIDIFVNVSERESFGVSVLEASASGVPVIVSRTGGLTEVVLEGKTGLIVPVNKIEPLADAIEKLIHSEGNRKEMGSNGRKWVTENFDWNSSVGQMVEEYRKASKNLAR